MKNFVPLPYRRVAVRNNVDFPLTEAALREQLLGRDAYRRTEFVVLRRGMECAVAGITKANDDDLFSPISHVEFLARPGECHWADDDNVDVGNPTQLAAKARALGLTSADTLVVHGKYQHVNFIVHPEPLVIRVVDVIPPEPAKLWTMVNQVLSMAEDLPPIELRYEPIDLLALARANPAAEYLFPCQASGIEVGAPVQFLDTRPQPRNWTMIGCERCMQMHRHFYHAEPERQVDFCPRTHLAAQASSGLTLSKCCLFESENAYAEDSAIVPWGGNLRHVEAALRYLAARAEGLTMQQPARPMAGVQLSAC